jgi:hypothetical protein
VIDLGREHVRAVVFAERTAISVLGWAGLTAAFWLFTKKPWSVATLLSKPILGFATTVAIGAGVAVFAALRAHRIQREWLAARQELAAPDSDATAV